MKVAVLSAKYLRIKGIATRVQCTLGALQCIFLRGSQYENGILNALCAVPFGKQQLGEKDMWFEKMEGHTPEKKRKKMSAEDKKVRACRIIKLAMYCEFMNS